MAAPNRQPEDDLEDMPETLDADDALEEIADVEGGMDVDDDDDDDREEIVLQNDSIAYFDEHKGSVFAIAQHPTIPSLIATGGGEGDDDDAPGKGYVFDTSAVAGRPILPPSYNADPAAGDGSALPQSTALHSIFAIDGHSDSINAMAFTLPRGEFLLSGGLDGRLRAYALSVDARNKPSFRFVTEVQEGPEVNWIAACPSPSPAGPGANAFALGGSDGSVWVYTIDASAEGADALQIVQTYFLHSPSACTAGTWSPDGAVLATVGEDSSLHVWDVWATAAARGLANDNGQTLVSLTADDQRFAVEGGLYSVAIEPRGGFVAVGGAGGAIKIVGLPRLGPDSTGSSNNATGGGSTQAAPQSSRQSKARAKGAAGGGDPGGHRDAAGQRGDAGVQRDAAAAGGGQRGRDGGGVRHGAGRVRGAQAQRGRARRVQRRPRRVRRPRRRPRRRLAPHYLRHGRRRPPLGYPRPERRRHPRGRRPPCQGVARSPRRGRGRGRPWLRPGRYWRAHRHGRR